MDLAVFALLVGAGARTSFLISRDSITAGIREAVNNRAARGRCWEWLATWMACAWCNGPWFMAVWLGWWLIAPDPRWFVYPAVVASASLLWGLVFSLFTRTVDEPQPEPVPVPMGPRRTRPERTH